MEGGTLSNYRRELVYRGIEAATVFLFLALAWWLAR